MAGRKLAFILLIYRLLRTGLWRSKMVLSTKAGCKVVGPDMTEYTAGIKHAP